MEIINYTNKYISDFEKLGEKAQHYMHCCKSARTHKIYKVGWDCFVSWCIERSLSYLPAQLETVLAYVVEKATQLKMSTLDLRILSIRDAHRVIGKPLFDPHEIIARTMRGIRNTHGVPETRKCPILLEDLKEMVNCLGSSMLAIRDKAILLITFAGAFRSAETVAIKVEDLNFIRNGIELMLPRSKIDQEGRGQIVAIPYGSNPDTCPVRAIQDWLEVSKITSGFLFRRFKKGRKITEFGVQPSALCTIVKNNPYIKMTGRDYSSHSLRSGFCTQAASKGVQEYSIMRQARITQSETLQRYIRHGTMWNDCAAMKVGL
jgi:integrase